jgi:hypothetical protein
MREPTMRNSPRRMIRTIGLVAGFDGDGPPTVCRGRPTSSAGRPRPAQQSDKTNPISIWEIFADCLVWEGRCWLSPNPPNEPSDKLDKMYGICRLAVGLYSPEKMRQTKPTLPEWQSDWLAGLMKIEQTKPTLPEWQTGEWRDRSKSIKRSHGHHDGPVDVGGPEPTRNARSISPGDGTSPNVAGSARLFLSDLDGARIRNAVARRHTVFVRSGGSIS